MLFHNSKNVHDALAQPIEAPNAKSSKLPSNIGIVRFNRGIDLCCSSFDCNIAKFRGGAQNAAKDLKAALLRFLVSSRTCRRSNERLPDVDLEGIIVSKAHNHHHANANEATSEHTLRRPQSRHVRFSKRRYENVGV